MSQARSQTTTTAKKRPSRVDRANHMNRMQSRSYMNQIEVLENNIRKKLKVIEKEKLQVSKYLRFLRTSSGSNSLSMAPVGRHDRPRLRPATARPSPRLKFGCDGNANHSYMVSDPNWSWAGSDSGDAVSGVRAKSACMSRTRINEFQTTMSRIRKVEDSLRKRVSWIDGGDGGDEGIKGYSEGIRAYSHKLSISGEPATISSSTQYEDPAKATPNKPANPVDDRSEASSVTSFGSSSRRPSAVKRKVKSVHAINVTFPFPVTPDKFQQDEGEVSTTPRRKGLATTVIPITKGRRQSRTDI